MRSVFAKLCVQYNDVLLTFKQKEKKRKYDAKV